MRKLSNENPLFREKGAMHHGHRSLSLFFAAIFFCLTLPARGDSGYVAELKARARELKLSESREWRLLGHWREGFRGPRSEVDGAEFFFAASGKTDPAAELDATLDALAAPIDASDEKKHAQCRFLARRAFLFDRLSVDESRLPLHPCPEITEWKRKLDPEAVSFVFASAYMGNAASMFGHTFLKFHSRANGEDRDLLNYGVSYFAFTGNDGAVPFVLYGLTGGYRGYFQMVPFHETLREYVNLEGRDVWEYRLALDERELGTLVDHLLELQQTHFDYFFLDENCSYQLLAAVEVAKAELRLTDKFWFEVIPADVMRWIAKEPGLLASVRYRPSLATKFDESRRPLDGRETALVRPLVRDSDYARVKAQTLELPAERRALVLDSAISYADLLSFENPDAFRDRSHRLKALRAQAGSELPPASRAPASVAPFSPADKTRPEQGHDPARVGLGYGSRDEARFVDAQFRFAYHHLLSDNAGYLDDTHLEVLRTTIRNYDGENPRLQDFSVVDIISLAPTDEFFQPLAWRADVGVQRLPDRPRDDELAPTLNGGLGYALEPWRDRLLVFAFTQAHVDASRDLDLGYRLGASAQAQAIFRPWRFLRLNAGHERRRYFLGSTVTVPATWARASFSLPRESFGEWAKNWELRADWTDSAGINETRALLFVHFLM